ncbi:MAG: zinc-ribbon domain-containing protein [Rhodobacteraceae bacterium]|nr:zinc-ribbon domain-containing protein [Paracoccaceae bacterium]
MRLICPNCDAQYEVDAAVIPAEGRDVQCSNCGHTWLQMPQEAEEESEEDLIPTLDDEDEKAPADEPSQGQAQRRQLDESVLSVLREEAAREQRARQQETATETFEDQPDLGLDAAEPRSALQERMARLRGIETAPDNAETEADDDTGATSGSRRDLLPDIEEINSTLSASSDRDGIIIGPDIDEDPQARSAFRRGFSIVVLVAAIGIGIYIYAGQIAALHPAMRSAMTAYVTAVDAWREWLNTALGDKLNSMTRALTNAAG